MRSVRSVVCSERQSQGFRKEGESNSVGLQGNQVGKNSGSSLWVQQQGGSQPVCIVSVREDTFHQARWLSKDSHTLHQVPLGDRCWGPESPLYESQYDGSRIKSLSLSSLPYAIPFFFSPHLGLATCLFQPVRVFLLFLLIHQHRSQLVKLFPITCFMMKMKYIPNSKFCCVLSDLLACISLLLCALPFSLKRSFYCLYSYFCFFLV